MFLSTVSFAQDVATVSGYTKWDGLFGEQGVAVNAINEAGDVEITTTSNPIGYYSIQLPFDSYTITFSKDGFIDVVETLVVESTDPISLDVTMTRIVTTATLSGIIYEDYFGNNYPIYGATIEIVNDGGEPYSGEFTTDFDGAYSFEEMPLNTYNITVSAWPYITVYETIEITEVGDIVLDIQMEGLVYITPNAPENLRISRLEDGSIKFEWDAVTTGLHSSTFEEVDLENPDQVTYEVIYHGGEISTYEPEIVPVGDETSFTIGAFSTLDVYIFTVIAIYEEIESSQAYPTAYVINTIDDSQIVVADVNNMSYGYAGYPFVSHAETWGDTDVSGISQTVYSVEAMGGEPIYIDELNFFIPWAVETELDYKISLGYKDNDTFEDTSDFVPQDLLEEVYDGVINFNSLVITIPITEFYYDATRPLVVQWLKPLNGAESITTYINSPANTWDPDYNDYPNKALLIRSTTVDFSELSDFTEITTGRSVQKGVASLVINKKTEEVGIGKELSSTVKMFPNPSVDGKFFVDVPASSKVEVFNASGVLLMSKNFNAEGIHEINLTAQSRGIYFLRINNNNTVHTIKALYK